MKHRIVIEMAPLHDEITEGACQRFIAGVIQGVAPHITRRNGVLPSSLKVKRYSRVVAAEFGRIVDEDEGEVA